VRSREYNR
jgi:hypothetical protein